MNGKDLEFRFDKVIQKRNNALLNGICAWCNEEVKAVSFKDDLSLKDYSITALCMSCQDKTYGGDDE